MRAWFTHLTTCLLLLAVTAVTTFRFRFRGVDAFPARSWQAREVSEQLNAKGSYWLPGTLGSTFGMFFYTVANPFLLVNFVVAVLLFLS